MAFIKQDLIILDYVQDRVSSSFPDRPDSIPTEEVLDGR
jgi:hypothetical protein